MRTVQPIPSLIGTVHHQRRRRRRTYDFIVRMISFVMRAVDVVVAMVSVHLAYHVSSLAVTPLLLYGTIDGRATTTSTVRRLRVGIVPFVTICVAFLCYSASTATASSSTTTTATTTVSSTNDYNNHHSPNYNIRSLDEYGNAQQLQYAKNAANRNGRRIVILTNMPSSSSSSSNSVWILSPITASQLQQQQQRRTSIFASPFHRCRHVNDTIETLSVAPTTAPSLRSASSAPAVVASIVHPISVSTSSYMIATGIGGDIHYLLQQLRTYYKYNYERYNMGVTMPSSSSILSSLPVPKVTSILQLLLRQFWDYPNGSNENDDDDDDDESGTWLPMGYRQMVQEQSSEKNGWGRPLGICGIVLQWHTTQQQYIMTDEFDPTGIVHQPTTTSSSLLSDQEVQSNAHPTRITCLGPQHELIQKELMNMEQLRQRYNNRKSNGSDNHNNTTTVEEDDTMIVLLQQQIIAVMERVIQNSTVYADNDNNDSSSPQQYQLEILHPPSSSSSFVVSSSSSSCIQHDIHIIQRQQRHD